MAQPPPGGYGPPPGGYGPPPASPYGTPPPPPATYGQPLPYAMPRPAGFVMPAEGSLGLGLLAGLFGCLPLVLVLTLAKGPKTRKGAWIGFAVHLALGLASLAARG